MMLAPNSIHCMDWVDLLSGLDDASVDLILTDPPYNTTNLDFEFELDLVQWWQYTKRVLKPGGAVVMTGAQPFTSKLVISNLGWFRYEWIWEKILATRFLDANRRPLAGHENVLVFSANRTLYNPQMEIGEPYRGKSSASHAKHYGSFNASHKVNEGVRFPKTVIKMGLDRAGVGLHSTQKPVDLFRYLIRTYTHEGALVVDPFCGSGTTGVAALSENRRYIIGDLSPEYCEIAKRRCEPEFGRPPKRSKPVLPMEDLPLFAPKVGKP